MQINISNIYPFVTTIYNCCNYKYWQYTPWAQKNVALYFES